MAGFIDAAIQDIDGRLKELKEEESRLRAARAALAGTAVHRGPGRPPGAHAQSPATPRRRGPGRPRGRRGGNTRATQALKLISSQPGITIPEIASAMKISPNYLYRVMPKLVADGQARREGAGWHATGTQQSTATSQPSAQPYEPAAVDQSASPYQQPVGHTGF